MTKTTRLIRTIYLYTVALISLVFLAVGIGNFVNTGLKAVFFQEAEKTEYYNCNSQPYFVSAIDVQNLKQAPTTTEDQKTQLDNLLRDYESWKAQNTGTACIIAERQKKLVNAATMIVVALPLYLIHWTMIKREKQEAES